MVAREIREDCHVQRHAVQAVLRERVRGGFHNRRGGALRALTRQLSVQAERVRRSMRAGHEMAVHAIAQRTDEATTVPRSIQRLCQKVTDGSLAICLLYTSPSPRDGLLSRMPSS